MNLLSSWKLSLEGRYFIYFYISSTFHSASICEVIFPWECILWKNLAFIISQKSIKVVIIGKNPVFTGVALLFPFKNFSLIHNLAKRFRRPTFRPVLTLASSLSLLVSRLWLKVRDMGLFLALEHLEATARLLTGLISMLFCLREQGGPERGREMREWPVRGAVTHIQHVLSSLSYMGAVVAPQHNYNSNIKDHT